MNNKETYGGGGMVNNGYDSHVLKRIEELEAENKQLKSTIERYRDGHKSTRILMQGEAENLCDLEAKVKKYREVIKEIDLHLRIPAAEYVPAIRDIFRIIDKAPGDGDSGI